MLRFFAGFGFLFNKHALGKGKVACVGRLVRTKLPDNDGQSLHTLMLFHDLSTGHLSLGYCVSRAADSKCDDPENYAQQVKI